MAKSGTLSRVRRRWRAWLRSIHRDVGYLLVGLTFIYAISGLALNHIDDWEPNHKTVERTHQLGDLPSDPDEATEVVTEALDIGAQPDDAYPLSDTELYIYYPDRTLEVDLATGQVRDTEKIQRFFVRTANYLHYNRQKDAWTIVADFYAGLLLFLAISGAVMLKGRKGFIGRGAVLILGGAAVPIAYVALSGGPSG